MDEVKSKKFTKKDITKLREELPDVIKSMRVYGNGFIFALSDVIAKADDVNLLKIKNAFSDVWDMHAKQGKEWRMR